MRYAYSQQIFVFQHAMICDAIAEFGPAEDLLEQGLDHAHRYWLSSIFLPPARPDPGDIVPNLVGNRRYAAESPPPPACSFAAQ